MVKSKPSASFAAARRRYVTTSAGSYPEEMEGLLDGQGRVSLHADDYAGYAEDEVAAFFASRDYEVMWITSEDGKVWHVASDFEATHVRDNSKNEMSREAAWDLIRSGGDHGSRMVHHHNHPITTDPDDGTIDMFSPGDVQYYLNNQGKYPKDGHGVPFFNVYKVHTKQGDTFTMKYDLRMAGDMRMDQFLDSYIVDMQDAKRKAAAAAERGEIPHTNRACADFVTGYLVDALDREASWYNIEFQHTWKRKG